MNYKQLIKDSGRKMYEVAHQIGISPANLTVWLRYPDDLNEDQQTRLDVALKEMGIKK